MYIDVSIDSFWNLEPCTRKRQETGDLYIDMTLLCSKLGIHSL